MGFFNNSKTIAFLDKKINKLEERIQELENRTLMRRQFDYESEVYINEAVLALAKHLNVEIVGRRATYTPPKVVIEEKKRG